MSKFTKLPFFPKNTEQRYFAAETEDFSLYARSMPKYSSTSYSNVIYQSDHKLGSPRWEIGASPIRYIINLYLQEFSGKP